ncbi:CPCC family cysteine-rich protein [[Flexibacter] sp. ATCC 35208]|uniref:CPCC family cysteine-rich protein n=1 Tax=[Flexibacter] sp. ATCC 35208 TaxID=1936242 RepID=UPI0009CD5C40|nr:CPCC family cysteine-rich protein [[Flexibacter] sp. ATCC 35208]OMP75270.1 hypothetical protein BW716_31030 [[Flexibacter] sp. ATCC 35208]OMP75837.1 hypothetical protein BW716_28095 [[Flexibacter] sp. ATCC 35208]
MNESEILVGFHIRRAHYDTYLQANDIHLYTCPGCGFPTLTARGEFDICSICNWEDDGQDDHAKSILEGLQTEGVFISGPNGNLSLTANRINIGRMLESNIELIDGEVDFDTARVLRTIEFYERRRQDIEDRMTGDELPQDHIWIEWKEVSKDLLAALVVPKL